MTNVTKSEEILLGIDYGASNTGIAFGRSGLAAPLEVLPSKNIEGLIGHIGRTVIENKVTKLIVGLPLDWEGKETSQSLKVRQFVKLLKIRLKRPVEFISEHGTTKEAIDGAIKSGISMKARRSNDSLSAAIIVKRYYAQ
ncbi:Holliday junction resolvase RuvX [candidate division WWE3 bacterium]|nr:Holliday junction resolvase RuvX [candidate division WWE3 bacterium]